MSLRILIDIGHPAHVHYFKNLAWYFRSKSSEVLFTCREKEFEIELLKEYGFNFKSFGSKYKRVLGKIYGLIKFDVMETYWGLKFKPNIILSAGSMYAAHAAWILRKPHLALEDTGNMEQVRLYLPFTNYIYSPNSLKRNFGRKMIKFNGINELSYLHPKYFDISTIKLPDLIKVPYAVLRFVSWDATHDIGQKGISNSTKRELIRLLSSKMNIYISAESKLPDEFKKYQIKICPTKIHELLARAELFIGEGATMAAESGLLGVPSFYVNSLEACNNEELAKYGLVKIFRSEVGLIESISAFIEKGIDKNYYNLARNKFIKDKIDVTEFLIENVKRYGKNEKGNKK